MHFSMISLMLQHKCSNVMCTLYYRRCGCLENKVPIDWLSSYWRHVVPIDCNKRLAEKPKQVMLQRIFVDMVPRYLEVSVLCHIWYLDFCVKFVFSPFQCCVHFASCCTYLGTISVLGKKSCSSSNVHKPGSYRWPVGLVWPQILENILNPGFCWESEMQLPLSREVICLSNIKMCKRFS